MENENLAKKGETKTRPGRIPTSNLRIEKRNAMKREVIGGVYGIALMLAELERKSTRLV